MSIITFLNLCTGFDRKHFIIFIFITWHNHVINKNKIKLTCIVNSASKIYGLDQRQLSGLYNVTKEESV